jgi:hypothetical protein
VPLAVDLHFLITVWSESAAIEQTLCAWAMSQLHQHPIMDVSSLTEEGGWRNDDVVQIIPAELSNEDLMRIWDALAPDYRLSLSYIARVIRIDSADVPMGLPVVVNTLPVRLELSLGTTTPWPVNPDLLEQHHVANRRMSMDLALSTGRMERVVINVT